MINDDYLRTAMSIARWVGLLVDGSVLTGADVNACSHDELRRRPPETNVFCRVRPEHKLRPVQAFRVNREVVAMTGDGGNNAPALKAAHIGIATDVRRTDVALEAADLVLMKDNSGWLVTAVRYGRRVSANLRMVMVFLLEIHILIVGL